MKKQVKKGIALLAAGILLTTSAAAYAAQLPSTAPAVVPVPSSSGYQYCVSTSVGDYTLTPDSIKAQFNVSLSASHGIQFRNVYYEYQVETEDGVDTSNFIPVLNSNGSAYGLNGFTMEQPISIRKGQRVHVRVTATAYAFLGYTPVGSPSNTQDFYFTL